MGVRVLDDVVVDGGGGSGAVRAGNAIGAAAVDVVLESARAAFATAEAVSDASGAGAGVPVVDNVPRPPLAEGLGESPSLARFSASLMRHETCFAMVESVRFSSSTLRPCVSRPDSSFVQQSLFRWGERFHFCNPGRVPRANWAWYVNQCLYERAPASPRSEGIDFCDNTPDGIASNADLLRSY